MRYCYISADKIIKEELVGFLFLKKKTIGKIARLIEINEFLVMCFRMQKGMGGGVF